MTTIQEILGKTKFTRNDLLAKCHELGIRGYSTLKKQELVLKIEVFVIDSSSETDIEFTPEEQVISDILDGLEEDNVPTPKNSPNTTNVEIQVNPDDFKKKETNASIHCQVIDKLKNTSKNTDKHRKLLLKTINNNSNTKYKLGDIILNKIGEDKLNKAQPVNNTCFEIICKDNDNNDKKILLNFDKITTEEFVKEHSYLKNINYDDVILDMDSKFKVDEFSSPIVDLSIFYAKINENHHMLETIYEFTDPPYPVLSNNEVIHNPNYFY